MMPRVSVPLITACPPNHRIMAVTSVLSSSSTGVKPAVRRMASMLASRLAALMASNSWPMRSSSLNAWITRMALMSSARRPTMMLLRSRVLR